MQATTPIREFPRIYVEVPVRLSSPTEGGVFKALLTRQLGQGGCMLVSDEYFGSGRILTLLLDLGGTQVKAISQVVYEYPDHDGYLSGLKFVHLDDVAIKALTEFIDVHIPTSEEST